MRLYCAPGTISVATAITLHEAGLDFDQIRVDFKSAEQTKPDYLARNPKGRVPTLEVDGHHLTEPGALLEYIATCAPQANLVPQDPLAAQHMRSVMYYLASTMHVNHAHGRRGSRWAARAESQADMAAEMPRTMRESATFIEAHGLRGPFVTGEALSLADPYLFVVCGWLEGDGVPLTDFPKIAAHQALMQARPSAQQVIADGLWRT